MALLAAAVSSFVFGVADFAGGLATRTTPARRVVLFSQIVGLVAVVAAAPLIGAEAVEVADLVWGAASGLAGMVALLFFYHGLAFGRISVVSPTAAITGLALPVFFGLLFGERVSILAVGGIALAVAGIYLISGAVDDSHSRLWRGGVRYGLAAGAGFGGFFVLISRTAEESGLWPLVGARAASVLAMAMILVVARSLRPPERRTWPLVLVAGVADIAANALFVVAVRDSLLILAGVIVSLYPVSTLILARFVLGERTTQRQRLGLVAGALAIVAITVN